MIEPGSIKARYIQKFHADVDVDFYCYYEYLYSDYREFDKEEARTGRTDFNLIVHYDASHLTNIEKLMEESLKTGVDLIFELVKDKKVVITDDMREKSWDAGRLIFY